MKLLVGLGNPGEKYANTRHNVGFLVLDEFLREVGGSLDRQKFSASIGEAEVGRERVLFMKPLTFMNLSGEAVGAACRFHKIAPSDVIAVHDELDLPLGEVRIKAGGGHGGHNGLKSLIAHLGSPEFLRIRVGIGRPNDGKDVVGWVLGGFGKEESEELPFALARAAQAARCVLQQADPRICMNEFNRKSGEA